MANLPPNPLTNGVGAGSSSTIVYSGLPSNPMAGLGGGMGMGMGALSPAAGPTGIASPMAGYSHTSSGAGGAEQPKRAHLYVGNLSGRVTEYSEWCI